MSMMNTIKSVAAMAPSRRWQWLGFQASKLKTTLLYRRRLKRLGRGSLIGKPLFWTPEFIEVGQNVLIWPRCRIEGISEYGNQRFSPSIEIRDNVILQQGLHITAASKIVIGAGVNIMFDAMVTDIDHDYNQIGSAALKQPLAVKETVIGPNCFIGAGAKIQAGTTLGEQCVVGANAVVRGSFPDFSVIVGIPARVIKRYDQASGEWRKTTPSGEFLLDS